MRSFDVDDFEDIFALLKIYADSGRLQRSYVNIPPDKLMEILLHKETFYYGSIKLVENIKPYDKESTGITDNVSDLFERIFEIYQKNTTHPATEDMLDFLLYIVHCYKTSSALGTNDNQYKCLYNKITKIYFESVLAIQLISEAPGYFNNLMMYDHVDVDFGRCIFFLCRFTDCVIASESREDAVVNALCEQVYHGIYKILTEKGRWSHFIDSVCFSEKLSERVYANHISRLSDNKKRQVLGFDYVTDEKIDIIYRHKTAIVFLTKAGCRIEDARLILQDYLQIVMVERKTLNHSNISIFNMVELMKEAFGLLERHKETSKAFFKSMLRLKLPELIVCTGLLSGEEDITAFIEEIEEWVKDTNDTDELLPRYNDEILIDIVLDKKIECLYSFVQKRLDWKLERYRKRSAIKGNQDYLVADSQRKRLIYIKGDIEEIKNCNDPFLMAAFKTDNIERPSDYIEVINAWKLILNRRGRRESLFSACYNYLYAIFMVIEKSEGNEPPIPIVSDSVKTFDTDLQWIIDYSINDEMNRWTEEQQALFLDLLIRTGIKIGRDARNSFIFVKEHTRLKIDARTEISIVSEAIKEQAGKLDGPFGIMMKYDGNTDDEDVIAALQKYSARSLEEKTKILAKSKAKPELFMGT